MLIAVSPLSGLDMTVVLDRLGVVMLLGCLDEEEDPEEPTFSCDRSTAACTPVPGASP